MATFLVLYAPHKRFNVEMNFLTLLTVCQYDLVMSWALKRQAQAGSKLRCFWKSQNFSGLQRNFLRGVSNFEDFFPTWGGVWGSRMKKKLVSKEYCIMKYFNNILSTTADRHIFHKIWMHFCKSCSGITFFFTTYLTMITLLSDLQNIFKEPQKSKT